MDLKEELIDYINKYIKPRYNQLSDEHHDKFINRLTTYNTQELKSKAIEYHSKKECCHETCDLIIRLIKEKL